MLRIGESDGMYWFEVQFVLIGGGPLGDMVRLADVGAEPGCDSRKREFIEFRLDLLSDICGVQSLICELLESRRIFMGRKRSLVRSKISEPMAPMADEYLSRLNLDSFTTKSANSFTRSASVFAEASFSANTWKRSIVP
jgi:hypothetical protein